VNFCPVILIYLNWGGNQKVDCYEVARQNQRLTVAGIILSGGPDSVYEKGKISVLGLLGLLMQIRCSTRELESFGCSRGSDPGNMLWVNNDYHRSSNF